MYSVEGHKLGLYCVTHMHPLVIRVVCPLVDDTAVRVV